MVDDHARRVRETDGSTDGVRQDPSEEADRVLELRVRPSAGEVRGLSAQAAAFAHRHGLRREAADAMLLALEEAVTNVLMHAFDGVPEAGRELSVCLRRMPGALVVTILDNGVAFDPTLAPARASADDGEEPTGGWGLTLIRGLVEGVRYRRVGDRNQLELVVHG